MKKTASKPSSPGAVTKVSDDILRGFLGYNLKRAFNVVQADLLQTLKPFELRMLTFSALALIVENPGLRQSQLATAMDIERPNLVVIIDELEQRELITRNRVPTDRRAYGLKATLAGRQLLEKAVAAVKEHEEALLRDIDAETRATVAAAMRAIQRSKPGDGQ